MRAARRPFIPAYGFLSENADFAQACAAGGIVFIGPSAAAIRAIGDKAEAKTIMGRAGVATVPGYHGEAQDAARFAEESRRAGLSGAHQGGGGRRRPRHAGRWRRHRNCRGALDSARNEALSAFGNGQLILENI